MGMFEIHVSIENKDGMADPEGETILHDLVLRGSYRSVSAIRTAKMLKFTVSAQDKAHAEAEVRRICEDLRIYNPVASKITVTAV